MAIPGEIGRRLSGARSGVEVGGDALARLRGAEVTAVFGLAGRDVAGPEVREHRRPCQRRVGAGWNRRPNVLTDFDAEREVLHVGGVEDQIVAERDPLAQEEDLAADGKATRGELPFLVELAVVRQVGLRGYPE